MNINIQSVHFKASEKLQAHVQEKLQKLLDLNERITRAEVKLYEDGNGHSSQFCEIQLSVPGDILIAKKGAATYEQAVLDAVATLQKVLRQKKD